MELWKTIPNYPGYEASNLGNIRSYWRYGKYPLLKQEPHLLNPIPEPNHGYLVVNMKNSQGKRGRRQVHRMILMAFEGDSNLYALHKNDNPADNRLENLYWGTQKQNLSDQRKNGLALIGEKCPWSKLTKQDIEDIKEQCLMGYTQGELAKAYEVSRSLVTMIINGKRWKQQVSPSYLNQ